MPSFISTSRRCSIISVVLLSLLSGCTKPQDPVFIESEKAKELVPDVRQAIASELLDTFGTVPAPESPLWFPIERGGIEGKIRSVKERNEEGRITRLKIRYPDEAPEVVAGDVIEIVLDPETILEADLKAAEEGGISAAYPYKVTVAEFSKISGIITLAEPLCELAEKGSPCIVKPNETLRTGRELYKHYCQKCHAATGDGNGPQAHMLKPKPRDLRLGVVKYTTTKTNSKASSEDLRNLLKGGIPGTAMPAFQILGNHEIDALVQYTKYLSMRGEIERGLCIESEIDFSQKILDEQLEEAESAEEKRKVKEQFQKDVEEFLKIDFPEIVFDISFDIAEKWSEADEPESKYEIPGSRPDGTGPSRAEPSISSLANGKILYLSTSAQCASCHGLTGKGDGDQVSKVQKKPDGSDYDEPGLHDVWGNVVVPRDLTYGVFHGASNSSEDIANVVYRAIGAGIKGTPMPAYGGKSLTDDQIWDLVNYIFFLAGDYKDVTPESLDVKKPAAKK